jgi:hypothetical protein
MKIERILHLRVRQHRNDTPNMKGGATVLLIGDTDTPYVTIKLAFCNPVDVFCKKLGREYAEKTDGETIPLRSLPGVLGGIHDEVMHRAHVKSLFRVNYDTKIRDFLPKD